MPATRQYQAVQFPGFPGGLNKDADSSRLEPGELQQAFNVYIGPRGEIGIRAGSTRLDGVSVPEPVLFLYPWRSDAGTDFLIAIGESGAAYYGSTVTFVDSGKVIPPGSTLSDFGVGFAGAKSKLYVTSKNADVVKSFDGTTWADVAGIPQAKHLWYRHGRMFAINDDARTSGIYFSELLQPEIFAVDDYLEINPEDGYQINCATVFGDDLILFKDNAIWKLTGRTPTSFAIYEVDSHRGSVSPRAVTQLRGRLFFFDRDTGVWAFDGAGFELVGQAINDYLLKNLNYEEAFRASMYTSDDRVFLSVPWGSSGTEFRQFVYSGTTEAWVEWNEGFGGRADYLDTRYYGLPATDGIWYQDPASSFTSTGTGTVNMEWRTGWALIGGPGAEARIRRLELTLKAPDTTSLKIDMFANYDEDNPVVARTVVGGPAPSPLSGAIETDERRVTLDGWGPRLHAVMFAFSTEGRPAQVNEMSVFFSGGVDVRGER